MNNAPALGSNQVSSELVQRIICSYRRFSSMLRDPRVSKAVALAPWRWTNDGLMRGIPTGTAVGCFVSRLGEPPWVLQYSQLASCQSGSITAPPTTLKTSPSEQRREPQSWGAGCGGPRSVRLAGCRRMGDDRGTHRVGSVRSARSTPTKRQWRIGQWHLDQGPNPHLITSNAQLASES